MAEPTHRDDPATDLDSPHTKPPARRKRTYVGTVALFFPVVVAAMIYWGTRPPRDVDVSEENLPRAEGTTGRSTPGGHNPNPTPNSAAAELRNRSGRTLTNLRDVFREGGRRNNGRRVELANVTVERVESPTLFWIRDGNNRIAVVAPTITTAVKSGEAVTIVGAVERIGNEMRIRASEVGNP